MRFSSSLVLIGLFTLQPGFEESSSADDKITLENAVRPKRNSATEPIAKSFSIDSAKKFLDHSALEWTRSRKCFTCHTNFAFLMARPMISWKTESHRQVRSALEEMIEKRWKEKGPRWDAEVVMAAATLAINDSMTTKTLHATTRKALDRMWKVQKEAGGFDWLKCGWPPMESDDYFGAIMALIAVGAAPDDYVKTEPAKKGLKKLRSYFANNPPPTLHHSAMLIWADHYFADSGQSILDTATRKSVVDRLLKLQRPDGGWAAASLGNWKREDEKQQDLKTSDGYGTAFVVFVLGKQGMTLKNQQLQRGLNWLKSNQRESGRWYARSLNRDQHHFLSHAATAFAVMAIQSCKEPDQP